MTQQQKIDAIGELTLSQVEDINDIIQDNDGEYLLAPINTGSHEGFDGDMNELGEELAGDGASFQTALEAAGVGILFGRKGPC